MRYIALAVPILLLASLLLAVRAQTPPPVLNPRGVLNAVSLEPAPSRVTPGGLLYVRGLNFGSPSGARASGTPLPTQLGDPPVEVLINNRNAPILSVTPSLIVVQVPWETPRGPARVFVRRGGEQTRAATVEILQALPAVRTVDDKGFGPAAVQQSGAKVKLRVTGLGVTEPQASNGNTGSAETPLVPRQPVQVYVGGLPAEAKAMLSPEHVGEYDVEFNLPEGARPGDLITVKAGAQAPANRPPLGKAQEPLVSFLAVPEGGGAIRRAIGADLRGNYVIANAARGEDGCYPSFLFDFGRSTARPISNCLIAAGANAASATVAVSESSVLAAMIGPAEGEAATGLTAKVAIFHPSKDEHMQSEVPAKVSLLQGNQTGSLIAIAPGEPNQRFSINTQTGEVTALEPAASTAGGAPAVRLNPQGLELDLGEGINQILSPPVQVRQGVFAILVGDDENKPTKAKLALLNPQLEVLETRDLPEGWLPLVPPQARAQTAPGGTPSTPATPGIPARPGAPGLPQLPVNLPTGGAAVPQIRFRVPLTFVAQTQSLYLPITNTDRSQHSLMVYRGESLAGERQALPEGWFITACTPTVRLFNLELSRRLAFLGSLRPEAEFRNPCPADGFLVLDPATGTLNAVPLPGQGQFNAAANIGDVGDYLYGTNTDPSNRGIADSLYVLDSVAGNAFRMDLPTGITGFANLRPVVELGALMGQASNETVGDAGLVWFDLQNERGRVFPVPDGFQVITPVEVFANTRKIVARGVKTGNTGSQYLIFDLESGDLVVVPNPEGVEFVAQAPRAQGSDAPIVQIQLVNLKSNHIVAGAFDGNRQLVGLMCVRIP